MFTSSPHPISLGLAPDGSKIRAEVSVTVGGKPLAAFEVVNGEHVIGRDPGCEICIEADDVSRLHARLTFTGYDFLLEDLKSANGVLVEGSRINLPTPVYPGQEIQIGRAHLRVRLSEEANQELMRALWDADLGLATVKADLKAPRYAIGATIATGGMGAVLQARDVHIRRIVAMKIMRSEMQFSPENLLRFIDEARLTGQLEHPNIVPMYELGVDDQGRVFYTMKYVKGVTLDEVLKQLRAGEARTLDRYPLAHLLNIFQKICDAMAFAHSKHVVHRDLKPENIMIGGYGEVLVMDWGLAKIHGTRPHLEAKPTVSDTSRHGHAGSVFHTLDGVVVGTPPYIAPEQARGEIDKLDTRTDVYGLGAVLYEILTLRPPIACTTIEEVLKKTVEGRIDPPVIYNAQREKKGAAKNDGGKQIALRHCPGGKVPDALSAVTMKALRLNPAERYQTVEDLQRDIESFQGGFATTAEKANILKQTVLLIRRHKANFALLSTGFVVINALLVWFIVTLSSEKNIAQGNARMALHSKQQADAALAELRGTAPTFAEEAQQLVEDGRFDEALQKISYAISQVPNQSGYYKTQGDIFETLLQLDDAVKAYEAALQRNPKDRDARQNLDLCKKLLVQGGGNELASAQLRTLQLAMRAQGRFAEAIAMMEKIEQDRGLIQDTWREVFGKKKGMRGEVTANEDGTLTVDITKATVPALSHLRGMPVSVLNLDGAKIGDITALSGLPLKSLNLSHTAVTDLGPLRGMKLERLSLADTRVADINAVRGMPLQYLNLNRTRVHDLGPLRGSPVRELSLDGCRDLLDLKPLMECTDLEKLLLPASARAIGFLRGHPGLKQLSFRKIDQPADEFWREFDAMREKLKAEDGGNDTPPVLQKPSPSPNRPSIPEPSK